LRNERGVDSKLLGPTADLTSALFWKRCQMVAQKKPVVVEFE